MKRLSEELLKVGVPLPFSVYDEDHNLLLLQGLILSSDRQIAALVERGLYADETAIAAAQGAAVPPPIVKRELTNPVEQLERIRRELNSLLSERPINPDGFAAKILGLASRLQNAVQRDADCCLAAMLVDRNSRYAIRHMVHVAIISQIVGEAAGLDDSTRFSTIAAALTMNLSMLDLQDALQAKQGQELTPEQRQAIRGHPTQSANLLQTLGVNEPCWLQLVRDHHECIDGTGYPRGLKGEEIAIGAQIIALADGYTARLERRADRDAKSPNASLREIFLARGKGIDPMLAALLVKRIGIFPPGLIVELENGEVAVVTKRSDNANAPEVHSILSPERTLYTHPIKRATDKSPFTIRGHVPIEAVRIRFNPMQFWATS